MDWMSVLMLWTPLSVSLFLFLTALEVLLAVLLYLHRQAAAAWFLARWTERSTAQARAVAMVTTLSWLSGLVHLTGPVPFQLVGAGWFTALALFIKSDAEGNPRLAAPAA